MSHPRFTLAIKQVPEEDEVANDRTVDLARGQTTVLGWNDTFAHGSVAIVMLGVAPALAGTSC